MAVAEPLFLSVSPGRAREVVAATLSEQGFRVRERRDVLEVERDAQAVGGSARVTFTVRIAAALGGSAAHFDEGGESIVATAAARVARARLAERGLVTHDGAVAGDSDRAGAGEDAALPLPDAPSGDAAGPGDGDRSAGVDGPGDGDGPVGAAGPGEGDAPAKDTAGPEDGSARLAGAPSAEDAPPGRGAESPVNTVAVLALVLGFVAPLGGVVAGVLALGILRRTRERGRALAIGGVVIGGVLTVLAGAAIIVGVSWLTAAAPVPSAEATSTSISPPPSETPAPAFAPGVGQCFAQRGRGEIGDASLVDCAVPHTYELFAQFAAASDADPYPGDDDIAHAAEAGCVEAFAGFVGLAYDRSALDYVYLSPTRKTWDAGDRRVSCFVTDPTGPVTGGLRGAGR